MNPREEELKKATTLLEEGRHEKCLEVLRQCWLKNPEDAKTVELLSRLMKDADQEELSNSLKALSGNKTASGQDEHLDLEKEPEKVFEAGYKLIDIREFELAEMLLKKASAMAPDDPTVHYELGFAMMSQAKYAQAARHFELVRKIEEDFDTVLNLSACYSLARDFKKSKELINRLEKLAVTDEEKYEYQHREFVLKRQEQLKKKTVLTRRDWLYILYGSILLFDPEEEDDDGQPKAERKSTESYKKIASTMMVLKGLLEGLRLAPEAVEFYSPTSRPLSAVLARLFDLPLGHYQGPDRPDHALLLMDWAPEIIGPHKTFVPNDKNRSLFCYGLPTSMPLPLIPDLVGHFDDHIVLPWKGESRATLDDTDTEKDPEEVIPEILERAFNLESDPDILKIIHESISYYVDKREYLVLHNSENFPHRPEYSAEVPGHIRRKAE
ncbi:MAG TPA: hypothetical protein PKD05_02670 [Candidatus Melainabacteria bacterium]|nr:hypothetical protein [Candidatus Melainabacteria bacterium]